MAVWFVSRHQGAIDWIKTQNIHIDHWVSHLEIDRIQANDIVIGTLPLHMVAQICEKGARFYFLSINLQENLRGQELTASQLAVQQCELQPFFVKKL
ncbi:CRISPR-associated protein Csx16 [Pasteurella multocida]|uniref:CRISPR-associated protein Csx16 n=1 Tax=Pasteurella multocida TaxID=747 RepID=UPI002021CB68|nr:CRISPR-associated protein Csx16 [Pasteurella multocida]MCL7818037.1 CRISPR-associated protein Csx16 [Pasteurella multocida]MEB3457900.1 CRISPR-associated protein Csx16 [Pasteurella multocida]MEB3488319.1 CRISPR-associated protein Csx16 [Pasteurella multocida]MEB3490692.1 CRISPR-associated protein Csx16 [Pasteurella multocida]HDR0612024.1 CRISPR-associated protein Csx16 [Pasteurella multocida]